MRVGRVRRGSRAPRRTGRKVGPHEVAQRCGGVSQAKGDPSWEQVYADNDPMKLPWSVERLDADIAAWLDALKLPRGAKALDLGSGPGTAAIHLARQGYDVTATDISATSVAQARKRAGALHIAWVAGDVFAVPIAGPFDLAVDRGLFHVLPDELRAPYAQRVAQWVKPRGFVVLKTFSEKEPPGYGPRRVTRAEVKATFGRDFEEHGWQESTFPGNLDHEPRAHLFVLRRR